MRRAVHAAPLATLSCGIITLLSYAACGPGLPSRVPLGGSDSEVRARVDKPASQGKEPSAKPAPEQKEATAQPSQATDDEAEQDEAGAETVEATDKASDTDDSDPVKSSDRTAEATKAPASKAKQCDDSGGSPPDCTSLETGPCGMFFGAMCGVLKRVIKPKVATAIAACLEEKNRSSECVAFDECIERGLALVCVDEESKATCRQVLDRCPAPKQENPWHTQERCERGLSSVISSERERASECLESECNIAKCFFPREDSD